MVGYCHPFLLIFFLSLQAIAQTPNSSWHFGETAQAVYTNYIKLKTTVAESQAEKALEENPDDGIIIYLQSYSDVIELLIKENTSRYKQLKSKYQERLSKLKALPQNDPFARFAQAELRLQWALVFLNFNEPVSGFWNLRHAYKLTEENLSLYPDFSPSKKTMGLLKVMLGAVPEQYQWIISTVGLKGDTKAGISYLNEAIKDKSPFAFEAEMYKALIYAYLANRETLGLRIASRLSSSHEDNLLIQFLYANMLLKANMNDRALDVLRKCPSGSAYTRIYFIDYQTGEALLNKGKYHKAIIHFFNYLQHYPGKNYIKSTYYRLFIAFWLLGDKEKAQTYLDKIPSKGQTVIPPDQYAEEFSQHQNIPHDALLKARHFYDGGYYDAAHDAIRNLDAEKLATHEEQVEYHYRMARILQKSNRTNDAITSYKKTIEINDQSSNTLYYAPNACLQLGYIYLKQKENGLAKTYFEKCLDYKGHEYESSIEAKAKLELKELD